jgi:type I restriction enzyme M protein
LIGAIIGDIIGSRFEFNNHRSKDFELFTDECFVTDDSIMTIAVAKALMESKEDYLDLSEQAIKWMQELGRPYPNCGYGGSFYNWIYSDNPKPYNSFGNGAAMRVSPVGWVAKTPLQVVILARKVTEISHNHPEGIKGAVATAMAIYMARNGKSKEEIREYIGREFYEINFTLDEIRETYQFNETCQDTVPQAFQAFFESTSFEDAIRNAISIGGDSDTLAAITGSVAEAYYGMPGWMKEKALGYFDARLLEQLQCLIK